MALSKSPCDVEARHGLVMVSCHNFLFQTTITSKRLKLKSCVALKLKLFRCRLHSLCNMFDYNEDKRSYLVTKVIFMAAENPSITSIHTPMENFHETKDLPGNLFFLHLSHSHYMFGDYQVRWPNATSLYAK